MCDMMVAKIDRIESALLWKKSESIRFFFSNFFSLLLLFQLSRVDFSSPVAAAGGAKQKTRSNSISRGLKPTLKYGATRVRR